MPNDPTLDASVQWRINSGTLDLHEAGYRSTTDAILASGLATEVDGLISAGKEADVYLARYNGGPLAIKVYRLYRTSRRGGRPVKVDVMSSAAAREFELLRQAWKGGARVPTPAQRAENMFSMRYLGGDSPAPRLQDVRLEDSGAFLGRTLEGVEALVRAGVVPGDLSAYNILVHDGDPWFIDFSEAIRVDRLGPSPWLRLGEASRLLSHGLHALQVHFRKYGLVIETDPIVKRILHGLDRFGVLDDEDG